MRGASRPPIRAFGNHPRFKFARGSRQWTLTRSSHSREVRVPIRRGPVPRVSETSEQLQVASDVWGDGGKVMRKRVLLSAMGVKWRVRALSTLWRRGAVDLRNSCPAKNCVGKNSMMVVRVQDVIGSVNHAMKSTRRKNIAFEKHIRNVD